MKRKEEIVEFIGTEDIIKLIDTIGFDSISISPRTSDTVLINLTTDDNTVNDSILQRIICNAISIFVEPIPHKRPKLNQVINSEGDTYEEYLMNNFHCSKETASVIFDHMVELDNILDYK